MITKMFHGAKGRFGKLSAEKRRNERVASQLQKSETWKERQTVRVGPVRSMMEDDPFDEDEDEEDREAIQHMPRSERKIWELV